MTPDQLLYGLAAGCLGAMVSAGCLLAGSANVKVAGYRLALISCVTLFVVTAAIALAFGDPLYINTIVGATQPLFYGAAIVVDRFASMFLAMGAGASLFALPYLKSRDRGLLMLALLALLGLTTIGNIVGLAFFLACLLAATWSMTTGKGTLRDRAMLVFGVLATLLGLFVASGGALFADLQAVAQYAGSLSAGTIVFGAVLSTLGTLLLAGVVIEWRRSASTLPVSAAVLLLSGVMYVSWRAMLFILPVLSAPIGLVVALAGLAALMAMRRSAALPSVLAAQLLLGLGLAIYAIAVEHWSLMNLAVFASMILLMVGGIASAGASALEHLIDGERVGGLVRRAPWLTLSAGMLLAGRAVVSFLCWWMMLHGVLLELTGSAIAWHAYVLFAIVAIALLVNTRFVVVAFDRFASVFLGHSHDDGMRDPSVARSWPLQSAALLVALAAVLAPSFLSHIGAGSLVAAAGSFTAAVASGAGSFAPGLLVLAVAVIAVALSILRGASSNQTAVDEPVAVDAGAERIVPFVLARWAMLASRVVSSTRPAFTSMSAFMHRSVAPLRKRTHAMIPYAEAIAIVLTLAILSFIAL